MHTNEQSYCSGVRVGVGKWQRYIKKDTAISGGAV